MENHPLTYGSKGEIIPEPLYLSLRPEHILSWWAEATGQAIREDDEMYPLALAAYHQWRMQEMLAAPISPYEEQLAKAVLEEGKAIQIAPVNYLTYQPPFDLYPMLARLENGKWALGSTDTEDWVLIEQSNPAEAMKNAQQILGQEIKRQMIEAAKNLELGNELLV